MKKKGMLYLWFVAVIDLLFLFFFCGLLLTQFGASLPLISHWVQFPAPEEAEQMGTITVVINYFLRLYILCAVVDVLTQLAYTFLLYGHFLGRIYGAKPDPVLPVSRRVMLWSSLPVLAIGVGLLFLNHQMSSQSYARFWILPLFLALYPLDYCIFFFYGILQARRQKKEEPLL